MHLSDVDRFGSMDAIDDQGYLDACFELNPTIRRILTNPPLLVLGRKGSGKTAICQRIAREGAFDSFSTILDFRQYDWERHEEATHGLRASEGWKYVALLSLATLLLRDQSTEAEDPEAFQRLRSFVIGTYGSLDAAFNEAFKEGGTLKLTSLESSIGLGISKTEVKAGAKWEIKDAPMDSIPSVIRHLNETLANLTISTSNPAHTYYLLFDELDRDFRRGDIQYQRRLEGLLECGLELTRLAQSAQKKIVFLIFLRTDIFDDEVSLPNTKGKIARDFTVRLDWVTPPLQLALKALMEKRFRSALQRSSVGWDTLFPPTGVGRPQRSPFQFILDHTLCRPRDIIQFCNSALGSYKSRIEGVIAEEKFTEDDLLAARIEYGDYIYQEIKDEAAQHLPDLNYYFEMLKLVNLDKFYPAEFANSYDQWQRYLIDKQSAEVILERLYHFSLIGFRRPTSQRYEPDDFSFNYLDPRAEFNRAATAFRVHEGVSTCLRRYTSRKLT